MSVNLAGSSYVRRKADGLFLGLSSVSGRCVSSPVWTAEVVPLKTVRLVPLFWDEATFNLGLSELGLARRDVEVVPAQNVKEQK